VPGFQEPEQAELSSLEKELQKKKGVGRRRKKQMNKGPEKSVRPF